MNAAQGSGAPRTMILMGGPIDTRRNPTAVNRAGRGQGHRLVPPAMSSMKVPFPMPGAMRDVYPGFLQLGGFMTMNLDRHIDAHRDLFWHLVEGDGDSAEKHREFYDEYHVGHGSDGRVLSADRGEGLRQSRSAARHLHPSQPQVDPAAITKTALMTIEGERDDISGVGQTQAAHDLCTQLAGRQEAASPAARRRPLRRLQRLPLPQRNRSAYRRVRERQRLMADASPTPAARLLAAETARTGAARDRRRASSKSCSGAMPRRAAWSCGSTAKATAAIVTVPRGVSREPGLGFRRTLASLDRGAACSSAAATCRFAPGNAIPLRGE